MVVVLVRHRAPLTLRLRAAAGILQERDARKEPTVPSTVADELLTNPFIRVRSPAVRAFARCEDPVEVLGALREAKNAFGRTAL